MPQPCESLTVSDISWLRLARHSSECQTCLGLRRVNVIGAPFGLATTDRCVEQKRLMEIHEANIAAEREARRAQEAAR